ncbi:hypothetical protein [Tropicimonas sp. IMCC34043]|uniref:hypothetical protein n=1 Tax=Tropicimonas sp. IMCC34043 TaxID=2248760 RepID=UPI000E2556E1|nr:hypothetical protein [Tropicimonas sp. IMCC34043]
MRVNGKPRAVFRRESGSPAIDWIVTSAAVLGLAIAILTSISDGRRSLDHAYPDEIDVPRQKPGP